MKYIKVNNLFNKFNQYDYKGLNTNNFIVGSHIYFNNKKEFFVATTEEIIPVHPDIEIITEEDYMTTKNISDEIRNEENDHLKLELENIKLEMQQGLAEMSMLIGSMYMRTPAE